MRARWAGSTRRAGAMRRWDLGWWDLAAMMVLLVGCGVSCGSAPAPAGAPPEPPSASTPRVGTDTGMTNTGMTNAEPPAPQDDGIHTIALSDEAARPVPGTPLTASVVDGYHKIGAPVVGVSVLVELAGEPPQLAQVAWQIESYEIDHSWRALAGQRWDAATSAYVDEQIPGWLVRMDSLDRESNGGTPEAITVSFKRAP